MRRAPINQAINCIQIEFNSATLRIYIIIAAWRAHKTVPDASKKLGIRVYDLFPVCAPSALNFECSRLSSECTPRSWSEWAEPSRQTAAVAQRDNSLAGLDLIRNQSALIPRNAALTINCINIACRPTLSGLELGPARGGLSLQCGASWFCDFQLINPSKLSSHRLQFDYKWRGINRCVNLCFCNYRLCRINDNLISPRVEIKYVKKMQFALRYGTGEALRSSQFLQTTLLCLLWILNCDCLVLVHFKKSLENIQIILQKNSFICTLVTRNTAQNLQLYVLWYEWMLLLQI